MIDISKCYYCQKKEAVSTKFGNPICNQCASRDIRTSAPLHRMNDKQKAFHLKFAISLFQEDETND